MQPMTPDNGIFMRIAYAIVCVFYFGYTFLLWRRNVRVRDRARRNGLSTE